MNVFKLLIAFSLSLPAAMVFAKGAGKNFAFAVSLCKTASKTADGDVVKEKQSNASCMQAAEKKAEAETANRYHIAGLVCDKHTGGKKDLERKQGCYTFALDKIGDKACPNINKETPDDLKKLVECYKQYFAYKIADTPTPPKPEETK